MSGHFDHGNRNAAYKTLQIFGVRKIAYNPDYLKEFRDLIYRVMGTDRPLQPIVPLVPDFARSNFSN